MSGRKTCLVGILLLSHLCCAAWSEPETSADEPDPKKTAQTQKEVQCYIDLVSKNDREDRESAYAKPRRTEKNPGWKSR